MSNHHWPNLITMFFEQALKLGEKPFLYSKSDEGWDAITWAEAAERVAKLASGLQNIGIEKGDRVVLVSDNSPNWAIADLAIMASGAITVPTYTTYTARDYLHILENSGAKGAIVSTKALAATFLKAAHQSDSMQHVITIEDPGLEQQINAKHHSWYSLIATSTATAETMAMAALHYSRDDIACLIYTSGTGGAPKGVKIHHGSILHNTEGCYDIIEPLGIENNAFLSFLPLSHAYEHSAGQFLPISIGATIWYAQSLDRLAANMEEASPTIMVVVPRLFEMLRLRLIRQVEKDGGLKQKLFAKTLELGRMHLETPKTMTLWHKVQNALLSLLVRRKVQKKFGGRIKALVSGGAPLSPDVGYFFASLGLPLLQGYGQTESGPVISVNPAHDPRMATVGKLLRNTEVKIADDGEILVRGELVMKGYWRDKNTTNKTLKNGWLHTGDIGILDGDGYLSITDRKKDIIINDKGDNVSPQRVEGMLALENEIAQAMVYGDRKPHLVGLIIPDSEWLGEWATAQGKSGNLSELYNDPDLHKALDKAVSRINKRLTNTERLRKFIIGVEAFSIENEQMTPTLKIRRHVISASYREKLESLY